MTASKEQPEIWLKEKRLNAGRSLEDAARALNCDVSRIQLIEEGKGDLSLSEVYKLCKAYGLSEADTWEFLNDLAKVPIGQRRFLKS